jgi:GT2 family glycosyltransferase
VDLSIIIVNWNTRELLFDCLASVQDNLGDLQAEVIVVDNASTDGSVAMVKSRFPEAVLLANDDNRGFAAANNQGFEIARGRHFLLLNSDTVVHGDVIEKSVAYMDENPDVGMMGCRVLNDDGTTQTTCSRYPTFVNLMLQTFGLNRLSAGWCRRYQMLDWDRDDEREVEVISGCYLLARAEAVAEIGYLDEAFFCYGEETDWCRRCHQAGWRLVFAPVGTITHLGSGSSRRLNHLRDLMLTEGTIRLHRKHSGRLAASAIWSLLLVFNCSRSVYWSVRSLVDSAIATSERAEHFRNVVRNFGRAWPYQTGGVR